jgi:hypothetical protein
MNHGFPSAASTHLVQEIALWFITAITKAYDMTLILSPPGNLCCGIFAQSKNFGAR